MICLEDFTKTYSSKRLFTRKTETFAVSNVSFTVENNSIKGLLGLNGSGKTTILKAICAIHYATKGNIFISDSNKNLLNVQQNTFIAKRLVGYVPEKPILEEDFTVCEFLNFCEKVYANCGSNYSNYAVCKNTERKSFSIRKKIGINDFQNCTDRDFENYVARNDKVSNVSDLKNHTDDNLYKGLKVKKLEEIVELLDLQTVFFKKIKTISKGFKQRVSFAKVLIQNPPIILLDEISDGLDVEQSYKIKNLIKTLSKDKTVLLSTHNISEVSELCSEVCVLSKGKLIADCSIQDLIIKTKCENLEQAFLKIVKTEAKNENE